MLNLNLNATFVDLERLSTDVERKRLQWISVGLCCIRQDMDTGYRPLQQVCNTCYPRSTFIRPL